MSTGETGCAWHGAEEGRRASPVKPVFQREVENQCTRQGNNQPQRRPAPTEQQEPNQRDDRSRYESIAAQKGNRSHDPGQFGRCIPVNRCAHAEIEILGAIVLYAVGNPGEEKEGEHSQCKAQKNDGLFEKRRLRDGLKVWLGIDIVGAHGCDRPVSAARPDDAYSAMRPSSLVSNAWFPWRG